MTTAEWLIARNEEPRVKAEIAANRAYIDEIKREATARGPQPTQLERAQQYLADLRAGKTSGVSGEEDGESMNLPRSRNASEASSPPYPFPSWAHFYRSAARAQNLAAFGHTFSDR